MASEEIDRLFSLPLQEFVAERKRLAKALRGAGRAEDARSLEKIPRPTQPAWVVNQLARRVPDEVKRLGELTDRLRDTGGPEYAATAADHRQTLGRLRDEAEALLGTQASPRLLARVLANLRAGVARPDTRAIVEEGRLTADVEESDFASLFEPAPDTGPGPSSPHAAPKRPSPTHPAEQPARAAPREAARAAAAAREQERARAASRAAQERRVKDLRASAGLAAKIAERAERELAAAREAFDAAEARAASTRREAETSARALSDAEAELARL